MHAVHVPTVTDRAPIQKSLDIPVLFIIIIPASAIISAPNKINETADTYGTRFFIIICWKTSEYSIRTGASIDENVASSVDVIIILIFFPASVFLTGI